MIISILIFCLFVWHWTKYITFFEKLICSHVVNIGMVKMSCSVALWVLPLLKRDERRIGFCLPYFKCCVCVYNYLFVWFNLFKIYILFIIFFIHILLSSTLVFLLFSHIYISLLSKQLSKKRKNNVKITSFV